MPNGVDTLVDPTATSPTAFGTSTDHAKEHSIENDAIIVMENALLGVQSTTNTPNGLTVIDPYGKVPLPGLILRTRMYAYGHGDVAIPPPAATVGSDVLSLSQTRLDLMGVTTYGEPYSRMLDVFFDLLGGYGGSGSSATWPTGSGGKTGRPGIVVIDAEKNDFYNPSNNAGSGWENLTTGVLGQVNNFQQALTASVALAQASARIESSTGTQTGTWTTTSGNFSSGSVLSTTVQGDALTFTGVVVPPSGVLWVLGYMLPTPTGDTSIAINGTSVAVATTSNSAGAEYIFSYRTGSINNPSSYQPQITQISGLTPNSTVSIAISKSDSSTNPIYVDCIIVPAAQPPLVVLVKDNLGNNTNPAPSAPSTGWSTELTVAANNKPLLDTVMNNVLGIFNAQSQNVIMIDLGYSLTGSDLSYVTGRNLNDRGSRKFSDILSAAIGTWAYRNDSDGIYVTL